MPRNYYDVLVMSDATGNAKNYRFSGLFLKSMPFFIIIALSVIAATGYFGYIKNKECLKLQIIEKKYSQQKQVIRFFAEQVDFIKKEFDDIRQSNRKFLQIAGVSDTNNEFGRGVGNDLFPSLETLSQEGSEVSVAKMASIIARFQKELIDERSQLLEVSVQVGEKKTMLSSTPSIWPVKGWMTSGFGMRKSPFTGRKKMHGGIDIATRFGAPVVAAADGVVTFSGFNGSLGKEVSIDHGFGYVTGYGHTSETVVKVGDKVKKGQVVAYVGSTGRSTGPHLHYEIKYNGVAVNPYNFMLEE